MIALGDGNAIYSIIGALRWLAFTHVGGHYELLWRWFLDGKYIRLAVVASRASN